MNKKTTIWSVVAVIVVIAIIVVAVGKSGSTSNSTGSTATNTTGGNTAATVPAPPVVNNVSVSETLSQYQNSELGYSLNYPKVWNLSNNLSGPTFNISTSNTIKTLNVSASFTSGKCAFPTVPKKSITDSGVVKSGAFTFNMEAYASTAGGYDLFNRVYTLQQDSICYVFTLESAVKSGDITAKNTVTATDKSFTTMVKSFAILTGATGDSETDHASGK